MGSKLNIYFVIIFCLCYFVFLNISFALSPFLLRSGDKWLMANLGRGKSRRSLSRLMRQVVNTPRLSHVSKELHREWFPANYGVAMWHYAVAIHRGTSTRPCGRTLGRRWRAQTTGRRSICFYCLNCSFGIWAQSCDRISVVWIATVGSTGSLHLLPSSGREWNCSTFHYVSLA